MSEITKDSVDRDKQIILQLMQEWRDALEAKDVARLTKNYADDILLFDACPPYKTKGVENLQKVWEDCLPCFPENFKTEHRDIEVTVGGDLAIVHGLNNFFADPPEPPFGETWMRITVVFRRFGKNWKVIHEHVSIPFNPMTGEAWKIADPEELSMPDYSQTTTRGAEEL